MSDDAVAHEFPPLTVPLTGAAPNPLIQHRWVSVTEGQLGRPPWTVWLDHHYPGLDRALRVGNAPRAAYDQAWAGSGVAASLAFAAVWAVTGVTRPRVGGIANARVVELAETQSSRWRTWPTTTLTLHGEPSRCPVYSFAGCWAAVVEDDPDSHLLVLGRGQTPLDVDLVRVSTESYGFAADQDTPIGEPGPPDAMDGFVPGPNEPVHPDWAPLME